MKCRYPPRLSRKSIQFAMSMPRSPSVSGGGLIIPSRSRLASQYRVTASASDAGTGSSRGYARLVKVPTPEFLTTTGRSRSALLTRGGLIVVGPRREYGARFRLGVRQAPVLQLLIPTTIRRRPHRSSAPRRPRANDLAATNAKPTVKVCRAKPDRPPNAFSRVGLANCHVPQLPQSPQALDEASAQPPSSCSAT
jgi:hypothetical protein